MTKWLIPIVGATGVAFLLLMVMSALASVEATVARPPSSFPVSLVSAELYDQQLCDQVKTKRWRAYQSALSTAKICTRSSECQLTSFGCPLGCSEAVRASQRTVVAQAIAVWNAAPCEACIYKCSVRPSALST